MSHAAPSEYLAAAAIWAIRNRPSRIAIPQSRRALNELMSTQYGESVSEVRMTLLLGRLEEWQVVKILHDHYAGEVLAFADVSGSIDGLVQRSEVLANTYQIGHQWLAEVLTKRNFWYDFDAEFDNEVSVDGPVLEGETEGLQQSAPASDRVVRLDHNQQDELSEPLEAVISLIDAENSIDGESGLRELVLGRLRAGRELVKAGVFSVQSLQLTLIIGLKMLAEKYGDLTIGLAAAKLLDLLLKQYGIG